MYGHMVHSPWISSHSKRCKTCQESGVGNVRDLPHARPLSGSAEARRYPNNSLNPPTSWTKRTQGQNNPSGGPLTTHICIYIYIYIDVWSTAADPENNLDLVPSTLPTETLHPKAKIQGGALVLHLNSGVKASIHTLSFLRYISVVFFLQFPVYSGGRRPVKPKGHL